MCSQLSLHTGLGLGKSLLNSKLHFSAVGLLDGFMELFPVETGQIWMSHEEEVAEPHPAKCQSCYTWPQARILFGLCLCKDGGFPAVPGVVHTPWIPTGMPDGCCCSRGGVPCPNLVQGLAESTELLWGALSSVPKALGAPGWAQCPLLVCPSGLRRNSRSWREPPSLPEQHRAQSLWNEGHGRKVEPGEEPEEEGEMPPWLLHAGTGCGSTGGVWPQELFLIHLKIHPAEHPQCRNSKITFSNVPKLPSPRTRVCHRFLDGFMSCSTFRVLLEFLF